MAAFQQYAHGSDPAADPIAAPAPGAPPFDGRAVGLWNDNDNALGLIFSRSRGALEGSLEAYLDFVEEGVRSIKFSFVLQWGSREKPGPVQKLARQEWQKANAKGGVLVAPAPGDPTHGELLIARELSGTVSRPGRIIDVMCANQAMQMKTCGQIKAHSDFKCGPADTPILNGTPFQHWQTRGGLLESISRSRPRVVYFHRDGFSDEQLAMITKLAAGGADTLPSGEEYEYAVHVLTFHTPIIRSCPHHPQWNTGHR
jgi:hypothetical protein